MKDSQNDESGKFIGERRETETHRAVLGRGAP